MAAGEDLLRLIAIKTGEKVFVSDRVDGGSWYSSNLMGKLFDGEYPKATFNKAWVEVKNVPKRIEEKRPETQVNRRYELREGFQETDLTPKVIHEYYIDDESEYYEVKGLYELKYDTQEEGYDNIDFEINVIAELEEGFEFIKKEFDLKHNLLDQIQTHPDMLHTKPCHLSKQESYNIIREHVKNNIDPKYAEVTSDYDFCLTVKKRIPHDPIEYSVNVNAMHKRRKPKYETRYRKHRSETAYEIAPKAYQSYSVVKEFSGKNYDDLKNNIDTYLDSIMKEINRPYIECTHCNGMGVVLDEN